MLGALIIFTLGYIIGGVTALTLIGFTLASRAGSPGKRRPTTTHRP